MNGSTNFNKELEYQVQLGSKMMPEYPCRSGAQAIYEIKKRLGIHGSAWHSLSISYAQYMRDHFIIGVDAEKVLGASFTGINSQAGDLLTFKMESANGQINNVYAPTRLFTTLNCDNILEISISSATVFD
jgi:hypothetical protein